MSGRYAFVDTLRNLYESSSDERKKEVKENIKTQLEVSFKSDLDEKVDRFLEPPSIGVIEVTNTNFPQMLQESIMCYVNGFYFSAISACGITAERLCMDIIKRHQLKINERILSPEELNSLIAIPHSYMVDLLYGWKMISKDVRNKLFKMNVIRNMYVHPDIIPEGQVKRDSLKILALLKNVLSQCFS